MAVCLPKQLVDKFLEKLKSGELNPEKLSEMTSLERNTYFSSFLGAEKGKMVNVLFESKLLLKNQQQGMINWAKKVAGMKPEAKRDLLSRIERLEKLLTDKEIEQYLGDLVSQRLGFEITEAQKNKIWDLAEQVETLKEKIPENSPDGSAERMAYGRAFVDFIDYTNDLRAEGKKLSIKEKLKPENIPGAIIEAGGVSKSLKSFLDNSALFRQGWKTLLTNPTTWFKNAKATYGDIVRTLGKQEVLREIRANIVSRANYELMKKADLDIGIREEAFPSVGLEKVPLLGRIYKASEVAYTGFLYKMRADVFDKYMDIASKSGIDITDVNQLKPIGKVVNSLTGRGHLAGLEKSSKVVNNFFFSPRLMKANFDFLTAHFFQKGITPFTRKMAATNLLKVVAGTAAVLTIAEAVNPGSVEKDPRSADFGKIKVGNTRFDVSGGMGSMLTLAMRLATLSSKSTTTGLVSKLNSGEYGATTGADVLYNFFENKLSPATAVIKNLLKGETFKGEKVTIGGELKNLYMPITLDNAMELYKDPNAANFILGLMADAHGISTNTYSYGNNWNNSTSKEMEKFKKRVGQEKFDKANTEYNQLVAQYISEAQKLDRYKALSEEKKKEYLANLKDKLKKQVMLRTR
jgi:hypothetical protein